MKKKKHIIIRVSASLPMINIKSQLNWKKKNSEQLKPDQDRNQLDSTQNNKTRNLNQFIK